MQGSMFRNADGWTNDPLTGIILGPFMSNLISPVFGPQNIPYLSNITATTGTGNNALAAVPTTGLPVPFIVKTTIVGDTDWKLVSGVFVGTGYVAPNDQAQSLKTWMSVG